MRQRISHIGFIAFAAILLSLTGCSTPVSREGMTPATSAISKHHPHSVNVTASDIYQTEGEEGIKNFTAAVEDAINQSKLFKQTVQGKEGDYELSIKIIQVSKPLFGGTFTVEMEAAWSLTKANDHTAVMRKSIKSSGVATMGEAFVGATRLRLAIENAARKNIEEGIKAIADLNL